MRFQSSRGAARNCAGSIPVYHPHSGFPVQCWHLLVAETLRCCCHQAHERAVLERTIKMQKKKKEIVVDVREGGGWPNQYQSPSGALMSRSRLELEGSHGAGGVGEGTKSTLFPEVPLISPAVPCLLLSEGQKQTGQADREGSITTTSPAGDRGLDSHSTPWGWSIAAQSMCKSERYRKPLIPAAIRVCTAYK